MAVISLLCGKDNVDYHKAFGIYFTFSLSRQQTYQVAQKLTTGVINASLNFECPRFHGELLSFSYRSS